jgi:cytosine/adenosine deaminase-related metal-dependent hydrolase
MKLQGARVAFSAGAATKRNLLVRGGRISFSAPSEGEPVIDLRGFLLLPGLINAHDHLEFSLFPKLGNGPYPNAKVWAADIYRPGDAPVREHLSVPKSVRLMWGGVKNLLSGVTTVAHHNPYDAQFECGFPVRVVRRFGWAHSLDFSPDLAKCYRATPAHWPFILHAGEGTDARARSEVRRLDGLGVLRRRTVLVHAIAVGRSDVDLLRARRSSIIWCPSSNLSTYGATLKREIFSAGLPLALGTDSALTAQGDLVDEVNAAQQNGSAAAEDVYQMVTAQAARVLRLTEGQGCIKDGGVADLVAVADTGQTPAEALRSLRPELVMVGGAVKLASKRLLDRVKSPAVGPLHRVRLEGRGAWFTDVDIPSLHRATIGALGPEYRLAGRRVWQ